MAGEEASTYEFMEELPGCCPPEIAVLKAYEEAWRFVTVNPPTQNDFKSWAAIKAAPPTADPCRWASCSLFSTKAAALQKLPKMRARFRYLAKIKITEECGFTLHEKNHIEFWRFKSHVPFILEVEEL